MVHFESIVLVLGHVATPQGFHSNFITNPNKRCSCLVKTWSQSLFEHGFRLWKNAADQIWILARRHGRCIVDMNIYKNVGGNPGLGAIVKL